MFPFHIFHQDIICLIEHIRTIPIRTIVRQIAILIHISIHSHDSVLCILLIKCVNQLLKISLGYCRIVLQNTDGHASLQFSAVDSFQFCRIRTCFFCVAVHRFRGALLRPRPAASGQHSDDQYSRQYHTSDLFHNTHPPFFLLIIANPSFFMFPEILPCLASPLTCKRFAANISPVRFSSSASFDSFATSSNSSSPSHLLK